MGTAYQFMVVDDDPTNNLICKLTIQRAVSDAKVSLYTDPTIALEEIRSMTDSTALQTVILLDINMPEMTGWEFLESYSTFSDDIREKYIIYIVSSSVDQRDQTRAEGNPLVKGFISKPVKLDFLRDIIPA